MGGGGEEAVRGSRSSWMELLLAAGAQSECGGDPWGVPLRRLRRWSGCWQTTGCSALICLQVRTANGPQGNQKCMG